MRRLVLGLLILTFSMAASAQLRNIPTTSIYDSAADAKEEVKEALAKSKADHKRLLLVFGADWCYDCHVLDYYFHQPENQALIDKGFYVIHVDIGQGEKNVDLANKYQIPLNRGVPAVAVLESSGTLLYSQKNGEFEAARRMMPQSFTNFLQQWSPKS